MPRKKVTYKKAFSHAKNVRNQMFNSLNGCVSYQDFKQFLETHDSYKGIGSAYTLHTGLTSKQRVAIDQLDKNIEGLIPVKQAVLAKNARLEVISALRQCNSYSEFQRILERQKDNMSYSFHESMEIEGVTLDKEISELVPAVRVILVKQARERIISSLLQCNSYSEFQNILDQDKENKSYTFHADVGTECALLDKSINELMPATQTKLAKQAREKVISSLNQCTSYSELQKCLDQDEENRSYSFHSGLPEDKELLDKLDQEISQLITAKKKELVPLVHIYTDFDGTITAAEGSKAVFSPFFNSLLVGYKEGVEQDYKLTPMQASDVVQSLFEAKFGKYDEHFKQTQEDVELLMSPKAVAFFHEALKSSNVKVSIVTRNRHDYIEAMLRYQGFSEHEIAQFNIMDSGGVNTMMFAGI